MDMESALLRPLRVCWGWPACQRRLCRWWERHPVTAAHPLHPPARGRKGEREGRPCAGAAGVVDGPALRFDEALGEGKAESARGLSPLGERAGHLVEGFEDAVANLGGDADAGVAYLEACGVA